MTNVGVYSISKLNGVLILMMGLVMAVMNVLLIKQNKMMKASSSSLTRALEIQPGTKLPPLLGTDLDGSKVTIDYDQGDQKTLLFVFSTRCAACMENMPNWKSLIRKLDKDSYRMIGISLLPNGVREYLDQYDLEDLYAISNIDPGDRVAYSLSFTPQLILIGADGKSEKVWTGVLRDEKKLDVERTLNVRLDDAD